MIQKKKNWLFSKQHNRLKKKFGSNTILDEEGKASQHVQALPSGILSLDCAIGIGGYPKGRLIELFGAGASGKTTVALQAVAKTQKNGGYLAYIDDENSLDIDYAENLGVKSDSLTFAQPDTGEEAFYMINEFVRTGAFDLILMDSVAALTPASEIDGVKISGQKAKIISERLSQFVGKVSNSNHLHQSNTLYHEWLISNKDPTPGGYSLKFYSSFRIEVKSGEKLKVEIDTIGKKPTVINIFGVKEYISHHPSVFNALDYLTREALQFS